MNITTIRTIDIYEAQQRRSPNYQVFKIYLHITDRKKLIEPHYYSIFITQESIMITEEVERKTLTAYSRGLNYIKRNNNRLLLNQFVFKTRLKKIIAGLVKQYEHEARTTHDAHYHH